MISNKHFMYCQQNLKIFDVFFFTINESVWKMQFFLFIENNSMILLLNHKQIQTNYKTMMYELFGTYVRVNFFSILYRIIYLFIEDDMHVVFLLHNLWIYVRNWLCEMRRIFTFFHWQIERNLPGELSNFLFSLFFTRMMLLTKTVLPVAFLRRNFWQRLMRNSKFILEKWTVKNYNVPWPTYILVRKYFYHKHVCKNLHR